MLENQRLLIFGDLRSEVASIERSLKPEGWDLTSSRVESAADFTEAVKRCNPDLIIFDCSSPNLDEASALLLAQTVRCDAPFIISGKQDSPLLSMECMNAGAFAFVPKSHQSHLATAVLSALQTRRGRKEDLQRGGLRLVVGRPPDTSGPHAREKEIRVPAHTFRGISECVGIVDMDGRIMFVNESFRKSFGFEEQEILGQSIIALQSPDNPPELTRVIFTATLNGGWRGDLLTRRSDGSQFPIRLSTSLIRDDAGRPLAMVGVAVDIADAKRSEEALRSSEEKYKKFFEEDLSGDYIATPDGRLLACNPAFVQIFGFDSVEDALKTNMSCLFPDEYAFEESLCMLRQAKRLARREIELRRKDGKPIFVVENTVGIFNEAGDLKEINGYILDDTDRRKLADQFRQSQKMEAIGRLAGGVAHDFNNLLSCIMGYCDFLLGDIDETSPLRADVEEIRTAGERASALVRQLLAFSRRQVLQPRLLDLNEVIAEMDKLVRRLIGEDINLRIIPGADLGRVKADRGQIEQVIMNLVVNSRDAMPEGGDLIIETSNTEVAVDVSGPDRSNWPESHVVISVRDTGCGMNKEVLSHLFEPFFTTKERGKGTGLGLSTVYGIVKQTGGFITAESEESTGSTFRIYLPQAREDGTCPEAIPVLPGNHVGFETILVVEDDEAVQTLTARALEDRGYVVLRARNGEEALKLCTAHEGPIHLLLTDLVMPGMSGKELARRVLEMRPATRVLYFSGYYEKAGIELAEAAQHDALLVKPFSVESLGSAVRGALDRE